MNKQIIAEASEWFIEFSAGDIGEEAKRKFDHWLRASPEHVRAYLEILPMWDDWALPLPDRNMTATEIVAWAQKLDNVVSLGDSEIPESAKNPSRKSEALTEEKVDEQAAFWTRWRIRAAAAIALFVAGGAFLAYTVDRAPTYSTEIGEQRFVKLPDGSTMDLNTRSRVRVRFDTHARAVELLAGQVLFQVAKDGSRPFVVDAGATHILAIGTQFDVYRKVQDTVVTVVEGEVEVTQASSAGKLLRSQNAQHAPAIFSNGKTSATGQAGSAPLLLSAGQQAVVTSTVVAPRAANVDAVTAWTQRRLVFDRTPLPQIAAEFNRYNSKPLVVDERGLADFHISGSFSSTDPTSIVQFLQDQPGLLVRETASRIEVSLR